MNAGRATVRMAVAAVLVVALIAGLVTATRPAPIANRTNVTAYFDNSNGLFVGDDVRILGVPVGSVTTIEPQPSRVKVTFWLDGRYKVPAEAKAVILSPSLVTARAIQLTPAYTSGLALSDGAVIPRERTAVPVEWDDVRVQLQRLTETLQPAPSDGVSPLGALINTAADNLRGQGANIRATVIGLSQAISALGDHSTNLFGTVRNLSILVTALQDSSELMRQLNQNLASITGLFANDPDEIENAVRNLDDVLGGVRDFVSQNRESVGTTSDKLASVSRALTDSLDDIEQLLHVTPTALQNFVSIYQPAQGTLSGALSINNLSDPISFICGGAGGGTFGRRAVGQAVRAIPGADRQESPVQLSTHRREPDRRCQRAPQRGHVQRGLDASGSRVVRAVPGGCAATRRGAQHRPRGRARRNAGAPGRRKVKDIVHQSYICRILAIMVTAGLLSAGCGWRGLNSLQLPGTEGKQPGAFTIQAQLPDVSNIQQNSRVRVGDVNVGNVTKIERQGWHALVTMVLNGNVDLPENATVAVGQTSLLGSLHLELAAPVAVPAEGRLHDGSVIPLSAGGAYPSTEQTLAAVSLLLNNGGVGQIQDITRTFSTAFAGRENDLRSLIVELDKFIGYTNQQTGDIIGATERLNSFVGQLAGQKPIVDRALEAIPDALALLQDERADFVDAVDQLGKFSALAADSVNQTKATLVHELEDIGPVLQSLADAGPALTRSLSFFSVYPYVKEMLPKWVRGDYANLTAVIDLTLNRLDSSFFTGTRFEGHLTNVEMQWGRTIGQLPSPYTVGNPLVVPYRLDQGR